MASADSTITQGDTEPVFTRQAADSFGNPLDLTGATLELVVRSMAVEAPVILTGSVTTCDAATGNWQYAPSTEDTATPGNFLAQLIRLARCTRSSVPSYTSCGTSDWPAT